MTAPTGLTTLTTHRSAWVVVQARPMTTIPPVHKSPLLTAAGSWLSTVDFAGLPTVSRTIGFRVRPFS
jgi:hypothetical protein